MAGTQPASSGGCCSPSACSGANQFKVNPMMARPWFSPAPVTVQVQRGLQDRRGAGGCLWAGRCSVWVESRTWSQLSKEKGRDVLSKMDCCCPAVFCGRPSIHYSHISHSKERPPRAFKCGICSFCRKVPRSSIITLLIPSACCFSVKNTIVPIPIPAQSYIPSRMHFSPLPQMAQVNLW